MKDSISLQFFGAVRCVTGSKYLLQSLNSTTLDDCGLFQGLKKLRLCKKGFNVPVHCTPSTIELLSLVCPTAGTSKEKMHVMPRRRVSRSTPRRYLSSRRRTAVRRYGCFAEGSVTSGSRSTRNSVSAIIPPDTFLAQAASNSWSTANG